MVITIVSVLLVIAFNKYKKDTIKLLLYLTFVRNLLTLLDIDSSYKKTYEYLELTSHLFIHVNALIAMLICIILVSKFW